MNVLTEGSAVGTQFVTTGVFSVEQQYEGGEPTALFDSRRDLEDKLRFQSVSDFEITPITSEDIEAMPTFKQIAADRRFVGYDKGMQYKMFPQEIRPSGKSMARFHIYLLEVWLLFKQSGKIFST